MTSAETFPKRSLAASIRGRAATLAQAQNTYKQNLIAVNALAATVAASKLPQLNDYPPDWQSFVAAYGQATGEALDWTNNVLARLLRVPGNVLGYSDTIVGCLQDAQAQAAVLVENPSSKGVQAVLNQDLNVLSSQLNLVVTFISGAVTNIQKFQDVLPDMATQLQVIATRSTTDAKADEDQVQQLLEDVAKLQAEILKLGNEIAATGIATGAVVVVGIVASLFAGPWGWLFTAVAALTGLTVIAIDTAQIEAKKRKVAADTAEMTSVADDASKLRILASNFSFYAEQSTKVEDNLQAILTEWQTLQTDVNEDIAAIRAAMSDSKAANFRAVENDLAEAASEWAAAYALAGALNVDLKVNTAQLQIGMSQAQVQSAMAGGEEMDIIEYYNLVASQLRSPTEISKN